MFQRMDEHSKFEISEKDMQTIRFGRNSTNKWLIYQLIFLFFLIKGLLSTKKLSLDYSLDNKGD